MGLELKAHVILFNYDDPNTQVWEIHLNNQIILAISRLAYCSDCSCNLPVLSKLDTISFMISWTEIDTVLLDLDGTLLDLHYDNYFWLDFVPQRYAEQNQIDFELAFKILMTKYTAVEGTLDWYCVDYWTKQLGLDIAQLKEDIKHLIRIKPFVVDFLKQIKSHDKKCFLVTNAHRKSMQLKLNHTDIEHLFDDIVSSHDFKLPKEHYQFWSQLQKLIPFQPHSTLFIDDSIPVLRSAQRFGIKFLLAPRQPDSQKPAKHTEEFIPLDSFQQILP